jgi:putative ABC transport system substrate-binding protein
LTPEVAGKRLALLHEVLPVDSASPCSSIQTTPSRSRAKRIETAAHATGVTIETFEARDPATLPQYLRRSRRRGPRRSSSSTMARTAGPARANRGPRDSEQVALVSEQREFAEAGGLITYGPRVLDLYKGAARYVDKIPWAQSRPISHRAAHEVRVGRQPQDRESARHDDPAVAAGAADEIIQ